MSNAKAFGGADPFDFKSENSLEDNLKVPVISKELAAYLLNQFSADVQIAGGLLNDPNVVRSEGYLLGFLAGLGYSSEVIRSMVFNQEGRVSDVFETDTFLGN